MKNKKPFHVTKTGNRIDFEYDLSLRNVLLPQHLKRSGGVPDLPDGDWIVSFAWRRNFRIIPGLQFREA